MTRSLQPVRTSVTALGLLTAVMLGHQTPPAQAGPPMPPNQALDVFAGLRDGDGGLDTDKLEPPGSDEYLNALADRLEGMLDDELEFCAQIGLLARKGVRLPNSDGKNRYQKSQRQNMVAEAQSNGAKPRRKQRGGGAKLDATAKRWRRGQEKIDGMLQAKPNEKDLKRLTFNTYDQAKLGPIDATDLFRLRQTRQAHDESLNLAASYFLAPIVAKIQDIKSVEDWRLVSRKAKKFGKEIQTGPDTKQFIKEIIQKVCLVGDDNAFDDLDDDVKQHEFEGYFLFSRQGLTETDDLTNTVGLVKSEDTDTLAQHARELLVDYVRVREFRIKRMTEKTLQYQDAEITAESLFPEAAQIFELQNDPDERLRELQKLFGAPLGKRTRTKDPKIIEWSGFFTGLNQDRQAEIRVDSGIQGQSPYRVLFDADQSPLGERALYGKLKLGSEVFLVAKVKKLAYAPDNAESLHFIVQPMLMDQRGSESSRDDQRKDTKGKTKRRSRPSKAVGL